MLISPPSSHHGFGSPHQPFVKVVYEFPRNAASHFAVKLSMNSHEKAASHFAVMKLKVFFNKDFSTASTQRIFHFLFRVGEAVERHPCFHLSVNDCISFSIRIVWVAFDSDFNLFIYTTYCKENFVRLF